jgi:hypothetical protein
MNQSAALQEAASPEAAGAGGDALIEGVIEGAL